MSEHPDFPETPKPTRERTDFFEKLANPAGQLRVCRRWDKQHARDMSEAPLHIKVQKFTELQGETGHPQHPRQAKKLIQRRAEQFELLAKCEIQAITRTTPSPEIVKRRRGYFEVQKSAEQQVHDRGGTCHAYMDVDAE